MDRENAGWSGGRWELSATESYALLYGRKAEGKQAIKLALLELVAKGRLRLKEVGKQRLFWTGEEARLYRGTVGERPLARPLEALLGVYDDVPNRQPDGGVGIKDLAGEIGKRYKSSGNFLAQEVIPALESRGLYEKREKRVLGLIPYRSPEPTAAGEAARAQLEHNAHLGEAEFARWVDRDPNRALAFLGMAGPAILLMAPLHQDIQRLQAEQRASGGDSGGSGSLSGDDGGGGDGGGFDLPDLDFDLDVFDGIGDAFDAIDSGVDAGGGGDEGGGDGGGGGD